jgi:hypothetical protein
MLARREPLELLTLLVAEFFHDLTVCADMSKLRAVLARITQAIIDQCHQRALSTMSFSSAFLSSRLQTARYSLI